MVETTNRPILSKPPDNKLDEMEYLNQCQIGVDQKLFVAEIDWFRL